MSAAGRVLLESAAIHGWIDGRAPDAGVLEVARRPSVGMGVEQPQPPDAHGRDCHRGTVETPAEARTTGATALGRAAPRAPIEAKRPWRMSASSAPEIRALLGFRRKACPRTTRSGAAPSPRIAKSPVIVKSPILANAGGRDFGKDRDAQAPVFDVASSLERAHVRFAIAPSNDAAASDLRFAAEIASRGGLDRDAALRAITLSPAEILGVSDHVGSLVPGKDADFVVYNGHPLAPGTSTLATWVDGEKVYERTREKTAVVLSVDELYVGDGEVLRPGEVLIQDGRIREVGAGSADWPRRASPRQVGDPGMIDA
jgi:imidazolonepropionase-like amidohydrolase